MEYYQFSCGCKFPVLKKSENNESMPSLSFSPNIEDIPIDCTKTWDLLSDGNTKGCFQLESRLGQSMFK